MQRVDDEKRFLLAEVSVIRYGVGDIVDELFTCRLIEIWNALPEGSLTHLSIQMST